MTGYTKLFSSIIHSSIWCEDKSTRVLWITMLAMKNSDGLVEAAVPGLAKAANISISECENALEKLGSPDKYSRNQNDEGRRIRAVPGGWMVVNHEYYMHLMSAEDRREREAAKKQKQRERKRNKEGQQGDTGGTQGGHVPGCPRMSPHKDKDKDKDTGGGDNNSSLSSPDPSEAIFSLTSETDKDESKKKKVYKPTTPPDEFSPQQRAFFQILLDTEFYVPGRGHISGWEAVDDPVRLARTLGDGISYPLVGPDLIARLGAWTIANKTRAKKNVHRFILNRATANQDRGIGPQPQSAQPQEDNYLYGRDLAATLRKGK